MRNEVLESFPEGRRIAFDPAKGRLWVICQRCDRWSLAPLEERFEIVERCEGRFRNARARVSTDNIGLARIASDLDLVRVGPALRPELAAWRYGPKLRRRRVEMTALIGASTAVAIGAGVGGVWQGAFGVGAVYVGAYGYSVAMMASHHWRRLARVDAGPVGFVDVRGQDLSRTRLWERDGDCVLDLHHAHGRLELSGAAAIGAARAVLPWTNRGGGSSRHVADAVELLENVARERRPLSALVRRESLGLPVTSLPPTQRLAIEMAANEDVERRAMEGELALLERAWRDAEAVAAIADSLLVPPFVEAWLRRHREGMSSTNV